MSTGNFPSKSSLKFEIFLLYLIILNFEFDTADNKSSNFEIISLDNNQVRRSLFKNKFISEIRFSFEQGKTPVLFTSRKFMTLNYSEQFNFFNSLALFIAELVAELKYEIGYLISKGGITTNVILSKGLKADYVYLEGQILTGISVVTHKLDNFEKLPIVTHPGNIGSKDSLVNIWKILENKSNF